MVMLEVDERFAERLRDLAAQDNAPLPTVLWEMLELYTRSRTQTPSDVAFEAMDGMFKDSDATSMSC
jgi:Mg-chelatase subunit ChlD